MMFFDQETNGIRVSAEPYYVQVDSDEGEDRYVFAYRMRIENRSDAPAQLVWRHWYIHDAAAGESEVEGEGVVGEQPLIEPGGVHADESYCVLEGPEGSMEGFYEFRRSDGSSFRAAIPRFFLRTYQA